MSSYSNNDQKLPSHLETPPSSQSSKVNSESTEVTTQHQRKLQKLVNPSLDIIEEKADDQGTGMDNMKVLLKDRKLRANLDANKKPEVKVVPNSVDILQRKQLEHQHHRDLSSKIVQRVKELQEMKQPSSLPLIPPRHKITASLDSLPLISRMRNDNHPQQQSQQKHDLGNIRYHNRIGQE